MAKKKRILSILCCALIILILIMDTKTASSGAVSGIELCIKVLIPALFPFIIIMNYMNTLLIGARIPGIRTLGRLLHIPSGGESILLLGLLGGYPVGAQLVGDMFFQGKINKRTCRILLGYCNNAGPSFIFGVTGILFNNSWIPLLLWIIHMLSAIITGLILPKPDQSKIQIQTTSCASFVCSMQKTVSICVSICGWVITFMIIRAYMLQWLPAHIHRYLITIIGGMLELSNGCIGLNTIENETIRFILCSGFLAFGGICVLLQTASITKPLGLGLYLYGKVQQTSISLILSSLLSNILFREKKLSINSQLLLIMICIFVISIISVLAKKDVEIRRNIMYNHIN